MQNYRSVIISVRRAYAVRGSGDWGGPRLARPSYAVLMTRDWLFFTQLSKEIGDWALRLAADEDKSPSKARELRAAAEVVCGVVDEHRSEMPDKWAPFMALARGTTHRRLLSMFPGRVYFSLMGDVSECAEIIMKSCRNEIETYFS